jgi:nitronate monooxygenase
VSGTWPDRRVLALTGAAVPIVQAPMAAAAGVDLCAAAIAAGALGSLPCALLTPDEVDAQVREVRRRAAGPLNLNFFCHTMPRAVDDSAWRAVLAPYYREFDVEPVGGGPLRRPFDEAMCAAVETLRPEVVSFHFGLPEASLVARVKASGAIVLATATTPEEARWLEAHGADAVVAQGFEAGGHSGRFLDGDPDEALGLFALLPQVVDAVRVPVVAAGGIGDGRGIAAAFALGAAAVQVGTAYLACPESRIPAAHRKALTEGGTVFTNLMTGRLARGVKGRLIRELGPVRVEAPPYPLASNALAPIRKAAEGRGEYGFGPMWAGQAGPLARAMPAEALTRTLAEEALAVLARLA